jgi:hypothetical protein
MIQLAAQVSNLSQPLSINSHPPKKYDFCRMDCFPSLFIFVVLAKGEELSFLFSCKTK